MSRRPIPVSSPTLSAVSTTSSFDYVSSRSRSPVMPSNSPEIDSDDEIVWSVSDDSLSSSEVSTESSIVPASDDDYVVLNRPSATRRAARSARNAATGGVDSIGSLAVAISSLAVNDTPTLPATAQAAITIDDQSNTPSANGAVTATKGTKWRRRRAAASYPSPCPSPLYGQSGSAITLKPPPKSPKRSKKAKKPAVSFGTRPIVDDISEKLETASELDEVGEVTPNAGTVAGKYITEFLSNPSANDKINRLTLLQAIITELDLSPKSMPGSLTAATALIKSSVFMNIRDYLAVRGQGQAALRKVMHPSRNALIKDIRKKGNTAPRKWVKQIGLQVLLVSCYH